LVESIRSEYLYADPNDPSLTVLQANGSSGYASYNFTQIPLDWKFIKVEQGSDLSFPEKDPRRFNGPEATANNDPADTLEGWIMPQSGSIHLDQTSKKEGLASLRIVGVTDSWGNLGVRYNITGTWNLSAYPLMAIWARSEEKADFSITLIDSTGETRTYWAIKAGESSVTTSWKRFVIDLKNYTGQTPNFNINAVDSIDFYITSSLGKTASFSIDDLTVDSYPSLEDFFYKARVLMEEKVIIYFAIKEA